MYTKFGFCFRKSTVYAALFIPSLSLSPLPSYAANERFFIAGAIAYIDYNLSERQMRSSVDDGSLQFRRLNDSDNGYRISAGYWFGQYVGVELGYTDLGGISIRADSDGSGQTYDSGRVDVKGELDGFTAGLLIRAPLVNWASLTARMGVQWWDFDMRFSNAGKAESRQLSGEDIYYGIGAQFRLSENFALTLDYDRYNALREDIESFSMGIVFFPKW